MRVVEQRVSDAERRWNSFCGKALVGQWAWDDGRVKFRGRA
jgi:hypothetical protein